MIRVAETADYEHILDLCEEFWTHTQFSEPFERDHTVNMVNMASAHGLLCVLVSGDDIVGFSAGVKSPLMGSTKALTGTELAWWVSPEHRNGGNGVKLLMFMESLAKKQGIKYWNMAAMESSMPEVIKKMYEKLGYKLAESVYTKVI